MTTFKIITIAVLAGVAACLIIQHQSQVKSRNSEALLKAQEDQLATLISENQRLSNRVAQAQDTPHNDTTAELAKLRSEAETLRKQTNALGGKTQTHRESLQSGQEPLPETHPPEYWEQLHQMAGGKSTDARDLAAGMQMFASDNHGQFPTNLEQIAAYLKKQGMTLSGTNQFEIVYQGSLNQLEGVPVGTVAVVRDQASWEGPDGKRMRVYGMTGGVGQIVASDDNFKAWEAKHIISPKADSTAR